MGKIRKFLKKLNIADWISISRILLAPFLLALILFSMKIAAGVILLICLFTDWLDGFVARRKNLTSKRGARLDSIGDIITFILGATGVIIFETEFIKSHLTWILIAAGLYIGEALLSYLKYGELSSFHTYLAKIAAFLQGVFMLSVFFLEINLTFFYLIITVTILDSVEEIILVLLLKENRTNVKGLFWVWK